jgi:DNA-binding NarL/FixJ family response regulator
MKRKDTIRVILADDHAMIRRGIRKILEKHRNIAVVGESSTGAGAIQLVHELQPDVLLLDIEMPDMKGYQVAREGGARYRFPSWPSALVTTITSSKKPCNPAWMDISTKAKRRQRSCKLCTTSLKNIRQSK